ncbi:glycosyltransferase [Marinilabiliaceae bacterium JC040]|nr:glycosyltransferase [Marinilabiliaceae bacterium JC040]
MKKKIVFIVGALTLPRCIRRIEAFYEAGYDIKVYGYSRGVNMLNEYDSNIPIENLGKLKNGSGYVSKVYNLYKDVNYIIKNNKGALFYLISAPLQSYFFLNKKCEFINEISDIRYAYPKFRIFEPILKFLDRKLIKKSFLTILTSEGFKKYFFKDNNIENIIVQPNRVSSKINLFQNIKSFEIKDSLETINFGFVGSIRFNAVYNFAEIIGKNFPKYKFHFFGDSPFPEKFVKLSNKYSNIYYHGVFKSPDDLSTIYSKLDIVVSCYDIEAKNVRIAEPNKLYEAMMYKTPILVSKFTFLERQVNKYNCGYSVNVSSKADIIDFVENIKMSDINITSRNIENIDSEIYIENHKNIFSYLNKYL